MKKKEFTEEYIGKTVRLKPKHKKKSSYTQEELYSLKVEGKERVPSPHRLKNKYKRSDNKMIRGKDY